jgi:hypothetical protein
VGKKWKLPHGKIACFHRIEIFKRDGRVILRQYKSVFTPWESNYFYVHPIDDDGNKNPLGWFWRICQGRYQRGGFSGNEMRDLYSNIEKSVCAGMEEIDMDSGGFPIPSLDELERVNMESCRYQEHLHFDVENFQNTTLKFAVSHMCVVSVLCRFHVD